MGLLEFPHPPEGWNPNPNATTYDEDVWLNIFEYNEVSRWVGCV